VNVRRSILLTVFLAGVCAVLSGALWQLREGSGSPAQAAAAGVQSNAVTKALDILRAWDVRRARAWAAGDVHALTKLYTPHSRTGAVDRAMLRSYLRRGLLVKGMHTQVLAADVRASDATHLTLVVTDRLATATAVARGTSLPLPRDRPTNHTVELVKRDEIWLVSEVR
jgi:hypothetical protein